MCVSLGINFKNTSKLFGIWIMALHCFSATLGCVVLQRDHTGNNTLPVLSLERGYSQQV